MKSLEFFKPTLATTLAIVLAWLLSVRPAQAGYTVTLQQVGPNVVATGSGAIDLTGLTFSQSFSLNPGIRPLHDLAGGIRVNLHGADFFQRRLLLRGPVDRRVSGALSSTSASSGSGDMVGITAGFDI